MSKLSENILELRINKEVSLQNVADATGISKAHVWELETFKSPNPSLKTLRKLANYYQISISTLIGEYCNERELSTCDADLIIYACRKMEALSSSDIGIIIKLVDAFLARETIG